MSGKQLLFVVLFGLLLVQLAVAGDTKPKGSVPATDVPKAQAKPAEPVKTEPKVEAPKEVKEAPKEVPKAPKEVPKAPKEVPKAPKAPKEVPKEAPKAEVPKETKADAPKEVQKEVPKETPKTATPKKADSPKPTKAETTTNNKESPKATNTKTEASFVDVYLPIIQDYAKQTNELAQKYALQAAALGQEYGGIAWEKSKELWTTGAALTQENFAVASDSVAVYKKNLEDYTHARAVEIVDRFFDPQHAQIVKKNYLNWYGVGILAVSLFASFMVTKHLKWVLSLTVLRSFLSSSSLAIYATLATLSILTSRDPIANISAAAKENIQYGIFGIAVATIALNVLSLLVLPAKEKTSIATLLSSVLFVDYFELRPIIEAAVGSIPEYSLETLVLLVQTILIFDSIETQLSPTPPALPSKSLASGAHAPAYIKEDKKEKSKKHVRQQNK